MSLTLELQSADIELNDEQFYRLWQVNRDLRLERTAEGKLIIMPSFLKDLKALKSTLNYTAIKNLVFEEIPSHSDTPIQ